MDTTNKQLWENSPLAALFAEKGIDDKGGFFNPLDPSFAILHESPKHRLIIWLRAQGKTLKEIAELTNTTLSWVSQVCRQPWARERMRQEIDALGKNIVKTMIENDAPEAQQILGDIMRDETVKPATRAACAMDILDRAIGKPKQEIESHTSVTMTPDNVEELDKLIKKYQEELNFQGVAPR